MSDWMERASCASVGGDLWFPEGGYSSKPARLICAECPVRRQCLEFAVANECTVGVWGGKSSAQIRRLIRERRAA
jgi:WhiB family redox-sensing transcriptional regulator